jgi:hypothetical protein
MTLACGLHRSDTEEVGPLGQIESKGWRALHGVGLLLLLAPGHGREWASLGHFGHAKKREGTRLLRPTDKREGERSFPFYFIYLFIITILELSKLFSNRL